VRAQQSNTEVGVLKGIGMEARYLERITWFRDFIAHPVALTPAEISEMVDAEVAAGRLTRPEARTVERANLVIRGTASGDPAYLVVEVSWLVNERDVRRAHDRARLLQKAGFHAHGAVAGHQMQEPARVLAERLGIERVIDEELDAAGQEDSDQR